MFYFATHLRYDFEPQNVFVAKKSCLKSKIPNNSRCKIKVFLNSMCCQPRFAQFDKFAACDEIFSFCNFFHK